MAAPEGYKALGKIGISYKGEYASNTVYERLDAVAHNGSTYLAIKDAPDGAPRDDKVNWIYLAKGFSGDIGDSEITFTEADARENIDTGESVKTVFGKIKKWFNDMTVTAFSQVITSNEDLMALTKSGYLVDALAVKNQFAEVNGKLKSVDYDITFPSGVTTDFVHCKRTGNIVDFGFRILSGSIPYGSPLATLPADLHPKYNILIPSQYLIINDVASTGNVSLMYNGSIFQEYSATGTLNACVIKGTFII
mgnify:CR=1 FL=1|nr:MAG TPA: hypothetical protein [Caudoviricetes sp.]